MAIAPAAIRPIAFAIALLVCVPTATAATVRVAVAANFHAAAEALVAPFKAATGHEVQLSVGSTGQLYAQIRNGAPYDVFLAADRERPRRLVAEGLATDRFTYAVGRIVLWSRNADALPANGLAGLTEQAPVRFVIANPKLAPYGRAAEQALRAAGQWRALAPRVVRAANVGQAFQYLVSGAAPIGIVALSQTIAPNAPAGHGMIIPADRHDPIRQDAVRLPGDNDPAAEAFMDFLRGPEAAAVLERYGYGVDG